MMPLTHLEREHAGRCQQIVSALFKVIFYHVNHQCYDDCSNNALPADTNDERTKYRVLQPQRISRRVHGGKIGTNDTQCRIGEADETTYAKRQKNNKDDRTIRTFPISTRHCDGICAAPGSPSSFSAAKPKYNWSYSPSMDS